MNRVQGTDDRQTPPYLYVHISVDRPFGAVQPHGEAVAFTVRRQHAVEHGVAPVVVCLCLKGGMCG